MLFKYLRLTISNGAGQPKVLSQTLYFRFCVMADMPLRKKQAGRMATSFKEVHYPESVILYAVYFYVR